MLVSRVIVGVLVGATLSHLIGWAAPERRVDPTFLYRSLSDVEAKSSDVTTPSCRYRPLFGDGD